MGDPAVNRKRFMQCVTAACMIMRRELFLTLSGLDEDYMKRKPLGKLTKAG